MASVVTLLPFGEGAVALLSRWLVAPHVARWYPEPQEHLEWAVNPPTGGERAVIAADGAQVGYLRWQVVSREVLDSVGLHDIPSNSVDIDILIGKEKSVGRGIGPLALQKLVAHLQQVNPAIGLLGLTTSIHNHAAQRAYRKAGFSILRQYDPAGLWSFLSHGQESRARQSIVTQVASYADRRYAPRDAFGVSQTVT